MEKRDYSPTKKALQVNLDDSIYGTFAEIGAGQEVARHFFQAGRASQTIAKTISAYDMTISDQIYGKESRYVCDSRLTKMLDYEFNLLQERLQAQRGSTTRFFAFADTVATSTQEQTGGAKCHGWMGIRFQAKPGGAPNEIIMHVKMWDRFRLQQQEALGFLGVNLIHAAFFPPEEARERISVLLDNLSPMRIEVNTIRFSGPDLAHLDNRLLNLELVQRKLTDAVLFSPQGEVLNASDALFKAPVFIQRGTFRPVTNINLEILDKGLAQFKKHPLCKGEPKVIFEITMNALSHGAGGDVNQKDFLERVDSLSVLGHHVLISNFNLFYQMKSYLRQCTDQLIGIVIGASHLEKMFDPGFYKELSGGILEGMSRLFDDKTRLFSFPFKSEEICLTAKVFNPGKGQDHLYKYLLANDLITDIAGCDELDTSLHSRDVRKMLETGNAKWKTLVPDAVRKVIEARKLFGLKS